MTSRYILSLGQGCQRPIEDRSGGPSRTIALALFQIVSFPDPATAWFTSPIALKSGAKSVLKGRMG